MEQNEEKNRGRETLKIDIVNYSVTNMEKITKFMTISMVFYVF